MKITDMAEGAANVLAGFMVVAAVLAFAAWISGPLTARDLAWLSGCCLVGWLICSLYRRARS